MAVIGIVITGNIHRYGDTGRPPTSEVKNAMPKILEIVDAGRKTMVSEAMVFMDELSFLVSRAIARLVSKSC